MSIGSMIRKALSAFRRSKTRGSATPVRRRKSAKSELASGAVRTAKKHL